MRLVLWWRVTYVLHLHMSLAYVPLFSSDQLQRCPNEDKRPFFQYTKPTSDHHVHLLVLYLLSDYEFLTASYRCVCCIILGSNVVAVWATFRWSRPLATAIATVTCRSGITVQIRKDWKIHFWRALGRLQWSASHFGIDPTNTREWPFDVVYFPSAFLT